MFAGASGEVSCPTGDITASCCEDLTASGGFTACCEFLAAPTLTKASFSIHYYLCTRIQSLKFVDKVML